MEEVEAVVEEILREYAARVTDIYKECAGLDERSGEYEREIRSRMVELDWEYSDRIEDELKRRGLDVEIVWKISEHDFFTGMGFRHAYVMLHVCDIIDYPYAVRVYAVFIDSDVYGKREFELYCVKSERVPIIDEQTPFSLALHRAVPWNLIREEWRHQIEGYIAELAEAERRSREELMEKLREVEDELRRMSWIYDHAHLLNAIYEVKPMLNR